MRRRLTAALVTFAAIPLVCLQTASADPPVCVERATNGLCLIWASGGGSSGGGGGGSPVSYPKDGGKASCTDGTGTKIPCSYKGGSWVASRLCYAAPKNPQPPKSDPAWGGQTTGTIYVCVNSGYGRAGFINAVPFWLATAPGGPQVDPAQLARQALAKMRLQAVAIGIVPEPGPNSVGLVGAPVWMWVAQPGPRTVGPQTATATAGAVTVTAQARMNEVDWSMGDGHTVPCGVGTAYRDSDGLSMSPDCGYRYQRTSTHQPGGVYSVAATSQWTVRWAGGGQTGSIPLHFTAQTQIRIGQAEAIVTSH